MRSIFLLLFVFSTSVLWSQTPSEKLAAQYFEADNFAFALPLYEDLSDNSPSDLFFYDRYLQCMLEMKQHDKAVKLVRKRLKKFSGIVQFAVDEGYVLEKQGDGNAAEKVWNKLLDNLNNEYNAYLSLASAFQRRYKTDWAIKVYEKGEIAFEGLTDFGSQLAQLYMQTGNRTKGIEKYVNMVLNSGLPYEQSKQLFEMNITDSADFATLRLVLLRNIQKMPDNFALADLLKWTFIKQKDWNAAFVQTKALDKRLKEQGLRVIELGEMCMSNEAWDVASRCFEYVKEYGETGMYYNDAVSGLLETRYIRIKAGNSDSAQFKQLESDYMAFIKDLGYTENTWRSVSRLAELYTNYLHQPAKAIDLLELYLAAPGLRLKTQAAAKLALGDAYIIDGDVWSSELLYAQVEKDFEEDPLGQEAKFRRARLSYFRGDFAWSQLQLQVLKGATTQLIANNAIELALKISENLGIDSNYHALGLFANAELLLMQNQFKQAEIELDSIISLYPGHSLSDDILYVRAEIRQKQGNYAAAAEYLETLAIAFSHDLLVDNAWYQLGLLYENHLNNPEKAMDAYKKVLLDCPGSLFQQEARKHFRKLRGDSI
jgi:tetratricopeptide (TPR) repeat protein